MIIHAWLVRCVMIGLQYYSDSIATAGVHWASGSEEQYDESLHMPVCILLVKLELALLSHLHVDVKTCSAMTQLSGC